MSSPTSHPVNRKEGIAGLHSLLRQPQAAPQAPLPMRPQTPPRAWGQPQPQPHASMRPQPRPQPQGLGAGAGTMTVPAVQWRGQRLEDFRRKHYGELRGSLEKWLDLGGRSDSPTQLLPAYPHPGPAGGGDSPSRLLPAYPHPAPAEGNTPRELLLPADLPRGPGGSDTPRLQLLPARPWPATGGDSPTQLLPAYPHPGPAEGNTPRELLLPADLPRGPGGSDTPPLQLLPARPWPATGGASPTQLLPFRIPEEPVDMEAARKLLPFRIPQGRREAADGPMVVPAAARTGPPSQAEEDAPSPIIPQTTTKTAPQAATRPQVPPPQAAPAASSPAGTSSQAEFHRLISTRVKERLAMSDSDISRLIQESQELARRAIEQGAPRAAGAGDMQARRAALTQQIIQQNRRRHVEAQQGEVLLKSYEPGSTGRYIAPPDDPDAADRQLLARLEQEGSPLAADVRAALHADPMQQQVADMLGQAFAPAAPSAAGMPAAPGGRPPGTPGGRRLFEALGGASGSRDARERAARVLGVADPNAVHITPMGQGGYALHGAPPATGPGTPGGGAAGTAATAPPFAVYDPAADSLTLQGDAEGRLGAEALRLAETHVNIRSEGGTVLTPLYGPGGQPRKTEAELQAMQTAGEQALAALGAGAGAGARASALAEAGLSPEHLRQQFLEGRISLQQSLQLNEKLSGIAEVDTAIEHGQHGLSAWASQQDNPLGSWFHEGTPQQKAVAINRYYDDLAIRSQGNILASPQRIEELRRQALGTIDPQWKEPGSASPGSAPKDGPAGFETIPQKGGGSTLIPSGRWTVEDLARIKDNKQLQAATPEVREEMVSTLIGNITDQITATTGYTKEAHLRLEQAAAQARQDVAAMMTWGDRLRYAGNVGVEAGKGELGSAAALAADLSPTQPDGSLRMPFGNTAEQAGYLAEKAKDTAQRKANPAAEKAIDTRLDAFCNAIKDGSFPFEPQEFEGWIKQQARFLTEEQRRWYDAVQGPGNPQTEDGKFQEKYTTNNSLDAEENLQLIQEYFKTHDPALLDEFRARIKKTPQRAKTEADQDAGLNKNQIAKVLTDMTGRDAREDIKGLPGAVGSHLLPGGPLARLGKGSRAAKNVARGVRGAGSIGGGMVQTLIENPDADFEDHKKAAVENFIASVGMRTAIGTGRAVAGGTAHVLSPSGPAPGTPGRTPPAGSTIPETATPTAGASQPGQVAPSASPGGQPGPGQPAPASPSPAPSGRPLPHNGGPPPQQASPSAQQPAFPPLSSTPEDQAHEGIQRLQSKEREQGLSLEEQRQLDQHQKILAASDKQRLEAERQALRAGNPPGDLEPHQEQALAEADRRLAMPVPGTPPPTQPSVHPLPGKTERDQADQGLKRLQAKKEKEGALSLDEQIELDRHEKTRAATRKHHLETEQQVLRAGKPPRELNPHRARILAEADKKLAMPAPGTPQAAKPPGGPGIPVATTDQTTTANGVQPASPSATSTGPGTSSGGGSNGSATHTVDGGSSAPGNNSSSTHSSSGSLPPGTSSTTAGHANPSGIDSGHPGTGSSTPATPGLRPGADTHNGTPDRAAQPDGTNPRGIELPGGRRGVGPEDSNLVMAGVGGGGNDPLNAHAAPPPATAGGAPPGAIGQTINGPASPAHPDAPQGSAGGGGASGGPLPPAPGQPPPSTPSDSGGQPNTPVNTTKGGQPPGQPGGGESVIPLDFAGSLRRIANINARPEHQNQHKTTQAELAHSREVVRARMAEIKAKGGNVTLAEATDLDLAEKSETAELKTKLENELRKNGQLTADQASQLSQAKATLARHAPMDPGPPPPVPQARTTIENLGKRAPATLTQQEAHQLANAQRAIARKGIDNLNSFTGPLTEPQERALRHFQAIAGSSPYNASLPPGPPSGYNPEAVNHNRDWYPPYGNKPVQPPNVSFSPEASALSDSEIATRTEGIKNRGHAWGRHGPEVLEGQLEDRVRYKVDPLTQTTKDKEKSGHHSCGSTATQFTSDRAMVQAVKMVENDPAFAVEKARILAHNSTPGAPPKLYFDIQVVTLEQALGASYQQHVRGKTRRASGEVVDTNLEQGHLVAIYKLDTATGTFHLHTLYPNPTLPQ